MGSYQAGEWARARLGEVASDLAPAVADALREAHRRALMAHLAGGLKTNDAYGAALYVAQHEQLVAATADLPGVLARKPAGVASRFQYIVIEGTSVVLMPWRFNTTGATRLADARMRTPVSDLRKTLLGLGATAPGPTQLALEQSELSADELESQLAEERDLCEQLAKFGRVVTVAFGSSPTDGMFEVGWGDAELISENSGYVRWDHWELLPAAGPGQGGTGTQGVPPLRPVGPAGDAGVARFDSAALNEDLGLATRPKPVTAPLSEPEPAPEPAAEDGRA